MDRKNILTQIESELERAVDAHGALKATVEILDREFDYFSWTGFYLVDNDELQVGPYVGKSTPHTRIKIGEGICGAAAESKTTIVVDDVHADPRFLACSLETKSEIVVPLLDGQSVLGEIDIDSDTASAFSSEDAEFLEQVAALVVTALKRLKVYQAEE